MTGISNAYCSQIKFPPLKGNSGKLQRCTSTYYALNRGVCVTSGNGKKTDGRKNSEHYWKLVSVGTLVHLYVDKLYPVQLQL